MTDAVDPLSASAPPPPVPSSAPRRPAARAPWALVLLLIPFIALLYPPFYAALQPDSAGIPFFVWYQFLWIIIGSAITATVYLVQHDPGGEA